MAVREILLLGNASLRMKCEPVKDFADPHVGDAIGDLRDTLARFRRDHGFGRGIAAPQIGLSKRIVFIAADSPMAVINPRVVKRSVEMMTLWDDCFSFPDILVKVRRHAKITVEFRDDRGGKQALHAEGGLAELLQHEIDHIDGILAIDRAIDSRQIVLRSEWLKMAETGKHTVQL